MKILQSFIIIVLTITFLGSCKKSTKETHTVKHEEIKQHQHAKKPHWSYTGEENPENWSHISEKYRACGGSSQSPINIEENTVEKLTTKHTLTVNYNLSKVHIVNNGHTEKFDVSDNNSIIFDGKTYQLKQFHMHSNSEHTVNNKHYPLEVHFVNKAANNEYAVIAVFFEEGEASPFFNTFLKDLPKKVGEYEEKGTFKIHQILPKTEHFYHYKGSFTTPPCTEIVEWIVLKEKLTASKNQLESLHTLLHDNYRPVQSLNDRKIELQ